MAIKKSQLALIFGGGPGFQLCIFCLHTLNFIKSLYQLWQFSYTGGNTLENLFVLKSENKVAFHKTQKVSKLVFADPLPKIYLA